MICYICYFLMKGGTSLASKFWDVYFLMNKKEIHYINFLSNHNLNLIF